MSTLVDALHACPGDPFAADLAGRLDAVRAAPDPRAAIRAELGPADLAGLARLRPAPAAVATLDALVAHGHAPAERAGLAWLVAGLAALALLWGVRGAAWGRLVRAERAAIAAAQRAAGDGPPDAGGLGARP